MQKVEVIKNWKKWDYRFLDLARFVSKWSKDPSTQVGAVIVDNRFRIVSMGFNGLPIGIRDLPERLEDRELKYKTILHAEANAILFANKDLQGCTLYTYPFMPCSRCAGMIIQKGVGRCVAPKNDEPRWRDDFVLSEMLLKEAKVELLLWSDFSE